MQAYIDKIVEFATENPLLTVAAGVGAVITYRQICKLKHVIHISVPATTANLGPGFDALGAAFELRMSLRAEPSALTIFSYEGEGAEGVKTDESNLIWKSALACLKMHAPECQLPKYKIHVKNKVPFGRGLGSSATAIIAGVVLANEALQLGLSKKQLVDAALTIEDHPDNLSPALYGGACSSGVDCNGESMIQAFSINRGIKAVVVIPYFEVATDKARAVLPEQYSRKDAVFNIQRVSLLPLALAAPTINVQVIRECTKDRIHQEYRAPLIPGLVDVLKLPYTGRFRKLISTVLSGAGPTILSLVTGDEDKIGQEMLNVFDKEGIKGTYMALPFAQVGTIVTRTFW